MIQIIKIAGIIYINLARFINGEIKHTLLFLLFFFLFSTTLAQSLNLFDADEIIELNLRADMKAVLNDRGEDPQYHAATLQYKVDLNVINIPIKIKTRGHFRKISSNCKYPPILLNFKKSSILKGDVFEDQNKLKLVTPCQGEKYVVNEYLVYKLYNLITPRSFKVRLVKIIFQDTVKDKSSIPYYGILMEEEKQMAKRNQSNSFEKIGLRPEGTQKEDFLKMAVFNYMIGNTDWSVLPTKY
jgi:hypothetical protein